MKRRQNSNPTATLDLHEERACKLQEIGSDLLRARQERGLSLLEVSAKTKIRMRLLQAIEEGNLQNLPEPVYLQGLIRRFAEAVDLNGIEIAERFPVPGRESNFFRPIWLHIPLPHLRPAHLYVLYIALVLCATQGLTWLVEGSRELQVSGDRKDNLSTSAPKAEPVSQPPKNKRVPGSANAAEKPAEKPAVPSKPIRVGLTFKDESWIRVQVDGKTAFEGIVEEGAKRNWEANKEITIRAGNAGGVLIVHNDGKAEEMGLPGDVKEVKFEASNPSTAAQDDRQS